jgi:hypothetical protein
MSNDSPSKKSTIFIPEYERYLAERDAEPGTDAEAEVAGPWQVVPLAAGGFGLFEIGEGPDTGALPAATFDHREHALVAAAVLPGTGRDPLFRLNPADHPEGFAIESAGEVVGRLRLFNPEVTTALHVVGCLQRAPAALARVFESTSGPALARLGRVLAVRLRPPAEGEEG